MKPLIALSSRGTLSKYLRPKLGRLGGMISRKPGCVFNDQSRRKPVLSSPGQRSFLRELLAVWLWGERCDNEALDAMTGSYVFCTNATKIKVENNKKKTSLQIVFTEFIYLKFCFALFFFSIFVSVVFNCQHCSVHKMFCKEEKNLDSVVSTLNMSLVNKGFNV